MDNLSEHISFKEATSSLTAIRLGINNNPSEFQLGNMKALAENVFEPLRNHFRSPIRISSFFRCDKLNTAVGGAHNSQHVALDGAAMDIDNDTPTNKQIFEYIKDHLMFDQLIGEFPDDEGNPSWVHVSWHTSNRKNVLISEKVNGSIVYKPYNA